MVSIKNTGSFKNTFDFLNRMKNKSYYPILQHYGYKGVEALRHATPKDTGLTADSWDFEIFDNGRNFGLKFSNSNQTPSGIPIVVLLTYGHGTGWGTYVEGRDFINPAIQPIFDEIEEAIWREVERS